jgi:hypothetical protein
MDDTKIIDKKQLGLTSFKNKIMKKQTKSFDKRKLKNGLLRWKEIVHI